jgi:hypothetical protein
MLRKDSTGAKQIFREKIRGLGFHGSRQRDAVFRAFMRTTQPVSA